MSRIGKQLITIPEGIEVKLEPGKIIVKGPKGELQQEIHPWVKVEQKGDKLIVLVKDPEEKKNRSLWGLFRRLIANMISGVTKGFSKQLEITGIGYKAAVQGDVLILHLGHSHPVEYKIPASIEIEVKKNIITISGVDKQRVGQTTAEIRALRKPEPYKGKGIKYVGEIIRRKVGKTAVKSE